MSIVELTVFAGTLLVSVAYPGPTVAALVARVISRGMREVLPFLAAIWLGELVWLSAAILGLAALAETLGALFVVVKFAGVVYLLVLAWTMWFASAEPAETSLPTERQPWRMFGAGLMVSIGNPKNMLFYMTLLPTVVQFGHVDLRGWATLCLVAFVILAAVDSSWAFAASRARALLRSRRAMRVANRTGASMMAGAAVAIAVR